MSNSSNLTLLPALKSAGWLCVENNKPIHFLIDDFGSIAIFGLSQNPEIAAVINPSSPADLSSDLLKFKTAENIDGELRLLDPNTLAITLFTQIEVKDDNGNLISSSTKPLQSFTFKK